MSMTVTATINHGSSLGIGLAVRVLTSAAVVASQNGTKFDGAAAGSPPQDNPTPSASGSYIYGAAIYGPHTVATVDANTTSLLNVLTGTNVAAFLYRSTGKTTSGTPVTYGGSAPTMTAGWFAEAEIKASGTLTEDASTPAAVSTASASSVVTAAFTPPGGALLVAVASGYSNAVQVDTLTMSDTAGLTWTKLSGTPSSSNGVAGIWIAQVASSGDTGTGSVKLKKASLAGSGLEKWVGTGSVALKKMGVAGSGNATSLVLSNNFTGLSSGTTLTTGNTGGQQGNKFDAVSIPASGTLAADNTHVGIFPMALKAATAGTAGTPSAEWLLASLGTARTKLYFRFDGFKTASASPAWRPFAFRTTAGTHIFSPLISGNALSFSYGSGFTSLTAFTNNTPNNSYFRSEGWIDTVAGSIHVEYYSTQTASTPTEVKDFTGLTLGTAIQRIDVGNQNSAASDGPFWLNYVGFSPDAPVSPPGVKMHKMGLAGSGSEKDAGTGSVKIKKMVLAGTAVETEFGTGSVKIKKMVLAGTAKETDHGTGSVRLKKMGVAGSGAVFVAGGGSVHLKKMVLAGTGQETDRGTGSVKLKKMGVAGSGLPKWIGTGSVKIKKMALAGSAVETEFGTGSVKLKKMGVAGSGQETSTASGSVQMHKMALSGTAKAPDVATGSVHIHKMGLAGVGSESNADAGTGSVHIHKMGLAGSGQETDHGTGSVHLKKMGLHGTGTEAGSLGSVQLHKMVLAGSGRETTSGPGHISMKKMGLHGIGKDVGIGLVHLHKMQIEATNKHGHPSNLFIFTAV